MNKLAKRALWTTALAGGLWAAGTGMASAVDADATVGIGGQHAVVAAVTTELEGVGVGADVDVHVDLLGDGEQAVDAPPSAAVTALVDTAAAIGSSEPVAAVVADAVVSVGAVDPSIGEQPRADATVAVGLAAGADGSVAEGPAAALTAEVDSAVDAAPAAEAGAPAALADAHVAVEIGQLAAVDADACIALGQTEPGACAPAATAAGDAEGTGSLVAADACVALGVLGAGSSECGPATGSVGEDALVAADACVALGVLGAGPTECGLAAGSADDGGDAGDAPLVSADACLAAAVLGGTADDCGTTVEPGDGGAAPGEGPGSGSGDAPGAGAPADGDAAGDDVGAAGGESGGPPVLGDSATERGAAVGSGADGIDRDRAGDGKVERRAPAAADAAIGALPRTGASAIGLLPSLLLIGAGALLLARRRGIDPTG